MKLINFSKPGQYTNNELNLETKEWLDNYYKILLVFPDTYDIGMSHYGFLLIFEQLRRMENVIIDRIFMPYPDYFNYLLNHKSEYVSLHYKKRFSEFDLIAISFAYELSYINFIKILELGEIKLYNSEREKPIILAGGLCTYQPEILKDIIDFFYIGESEFFLEKIILHLIENKKKTKEEILSSLKVYDNLYIPQIKENAKKHIALSLYKNFSKQIVPLIKTVHNRGVIEIMRGCLNNCRFCQPGYVYRPLKILSVDEIYELTKELYYSTGYEEITYLSLSPSDYLYLNELIIKLMPFIIENKISISFPSQRIDKLDDELCKFLMQGKKSSITLAIEAGSQRLRDIINKNIKEEEIYNAVKYAIRNQWKKIKFYFMIGLPGENEEDINEIIYLINNLSNEFKREKIQFNITISNFIPKPHTPFEEIRINSISELNEKINKIKYSIKNKNVNLTFTDPYQSHLEYIFSVGNNLVIRNLIKYLEKENNLILQDRREYFKREKWKKFIEENFELRGKWNNIKIGLTKDYLKKEYENFKNSIITKSCFENSCSKCGIENCNIIKLQKDNRENLNKKILISEEKKQIKEKIKYRIEYIRTEKVKYLSITEIQNLWNRILRRLKLKLIFSKGFNQQPEMIFSPAIPVGIISNKEYIEFFTAEDFDLLSIKDQINLITNNLIKVTNLSKILKDEKDEINIKNGIIEYIIEFEYKPKAKIEKLKEVKYFECLKNDKSKKSYEIEKFIKEIKEEENKIILLVNIINSETIPIIKFLKENFDLSEIKNIIKNEVIKS